jgi:hypothetical protein
MCTLLMLPHEPQEVARLHAGSGAPARRALTGTQARAGRRRRAPTMDRQPARAAHRAACNDERNPSADVPMLVRDGRARSRLVVVVDEIGHHRCASRGTSHVAGQAARRAPWARCTDGVRPIRSQSPRRSAHCCAEVPSPYANTACGIAGPMSARLPAEAIASLGVRARV